MKRILISLIKLYQKIPFTAHFHCKYIPTCSNYALVVINDFGFFKGFWLTLKRIIKCNPFSKGGIDLPPTKEKK